MEKATAKEGKGKEKGREQGKGKNNSGKRNGGFGGMSNVSKGGMNRFLAAVDTVGNGVHKKTRCHQWQGRRPMALGAMGLHPSHSVASDTGPSVSQRVQAVNSSPVPPAFWSTVAADADEDWPEECCYDWEAGTGRIHE